MNRPRSITIICIFYWFSALIFSAVGIISFFLLFGPNSLSLDKFINNVAPLEYFLLTMPIAIIAVGVFLATTGWGLWGLKKWARPAAIIGSSLLVIFGLLTIIIKISQGEIGISYLPILHGLVLWGLFQDNVKVAFGALSPEEYAASADWEDEVINEVFSGQDICSE